MVRNDIKNSSLLKTKFLIYAFNGRTKKRGAKKISAEGRHKQNLKHYKSNNKQRKTNPNPTKTKPQKQPIETLKSICNTPNHYSPKPSRDCIKTALKPPKNQPQKTTQKKHLSPRSKAFGKGAEETGRKPR